MGDRCFLCITNDKRIISKSVYAIARLDGNPAVPGHILVSPKRHVGSIFELEPFEIKSLWREICRVRLMFGSVISDDHPDAWNIGINDGPAAGQTVPHAHIHMIPRRVGDQEDPRGGIRRGLPNGDPDRWANIEIAGGSFGGGRGYP